MLAPRENQTVTLPVEVVIETTNYGGGRLHISAGGQIFIVPIGAQGGTIYADRLPEGLYDITFTLAGPDGTALQYAQAKVVVKQVTVLTRGAGG